MQKINAEGGITVAKSGKHLAPKAPKKKIGSHLKPAENEQNNEALEPQETDGADKKSGFENFKNGFKKRLKRLLNRKRKPKKEKKKLSRNEAVTRALLILAVLLFCFFTITPLRGCVMGSGGYVGEKAAEKTAIADSGVKSSDVQDIVTDMIKLDGDTCYKIEFKSNTNGYKYIVNAETGDIVAQGFYKITETED